MCDTLVLFCSCADEPVKAKERCSPRTLGEFQFRSLNYMSLDKVACEPSSWSCQAAGYRGQDLRRDSLILQGALCTIWPWKLKDRYRRQKAARW